MTGIASLKKTAIAAVIAATAFFFFMRLDLLRKVPGFYCENFGCIGNGIFYFALALGVIPLVFTVYGYLTAPEKRWRRAFLSGGMSLACMAGCLMLVFAFQQADIRRNVEASDKAEIEFQREVDAAKKAK